MNAHSQTLSGGQDFQERQPEEQAVSLGKSALEGLQLVAQRIDAIDFLLP